MFWSGSGKFLAPVWGGRWNQLWISDGLLSLICLWHAQCFRDKGATGQNINSWYQFMRLANADYLRNSLSRGFSPLPPRRWVSAWWSTKPHKIWRTMDCALHTSTIHTLFFFTVWKDWASQEADDNLALARYVLKRSRRNEGTRSAPQFCDWLEKKHQSLSVVSPSHFTLHGPACQIWVQVHGRTQVPGAGTRWLSQFGCTVISNSKSVFGISRKKHIFHTIRSQKNKEGRRVTGRVHCFRSAT